MLKNSIPFRLVGAIKASLLCCAMKTTQFLRLSLLALWLTQLSPAHAITFTSDALIGVNDTTFDGLDIIVSNCVLTVDGPHSFASVQVLIGGVITHSFAANGNLAAPIY